MARKILLADDSVTAQNMGRKILADAGYEVMTVNNGSAALKKIAESKPDLVILDVYMPGYSGLEVCQRLKESSDSSRIPVLLTVGKLEPFKPEEAQRVRAEGFIVKPFEASELLSALSKLEDKIVPRAESSKSGRFARAIAAVEDSSRGRSSEFGEADENGWKSRIAFPHKKTETEEAEEKVADDPSIYNQLNRDLRTVVATPKETTSEAVEEKKETKKYNRRKEDREQSERAEKSSVDVAALGSPGLPQDVTPEEVAAIAAAAAQIKSLQAAIQNEAVPETQVTQPQATQAPVPDAPLVEAELPKNSVAATTAPETQVAVAETSAAPEAARLPELVPVPVQPVSVQTEKISETTPAIFAGEAQDTSDAPVTMAVATAEVAAIAEVSPSRWSAVSVALDADEAAVSLEQEMQKAYTAFVAEETPAAELSTQIESASPESLPAPIETLAPQEPIVAISNPEPEPIPVAKTAPEAGAIALPRSEVAAALPKSQDDLSGAGAQHAASVESNLKPAYPQFAKAVLPDAEIAHQTPEQVAESAVVSAVTVEPEASPASIAEVATVESAVSTKAFTSFSPQTKQEEVSQPQEENLGPANRNEDDHESDALKTTAAAWASWRQIRDADAPPKAEAPALGREVEGHSQGTLEHTQDPPEPAQVPVENAQEPLEPVAAAMAVAAGAEQAPQQVPQPASEAPGDVASIVDSLLADLRPKLMAEISRKMSEKK